MNASGPTVYLDYASTSAIRPPVVQQAIAEFLEHNGATPGRGGHRRAVDADRIALQCRQSIAALLDIPGDPGRIAFFPNATYGINAALRGALKENDAVVVTTYDHNAVLRPVHALARERGIEVRLVAGDANGALDMHAFETAIDGAKLVVLNAVSNVIGTALDIAALTRTAHAAGALVLVDAAQAAGEIPVSVRADSPDLFAFTGHKGLLGPPGTGGLWVRDGVEVEAFAAGGTGGDSLDPLMPATYPDHFEAGSQNGLGMAGLHAGVAWLLENDVAKIHAQVRRLAQRMHAELSSMSGIRVLTPPGAAAPIVTIVSDAIDPATLAMRLDREHGILTRAGLHCAPEVHRMLGTEKTGAVRISAGWATTEDDIDRALRSIEMTARVKIFAGS